MKKLQRVRPVAGLAALALGLPWLPAAAEAQGASGLATFDWEEVETVCLDGRPGSDRLRFENAVHWIPLDQFNAARRCRLSWQDAFAR